MDILGPIAAGTAGAVVFQLVGYGQGWRPEVMVRRATQMAFAVVLSMLAVAVYLSVTTANTNLALRLDSTEARLTLMEQIIHNMEKHNNERMSNSASSTTLSKGPRDDVNEEGDHDAQRDESMIPDISDEDSQDDATMEQHRPWRLFNVPEDHVFVVHCVGEELRVLIRPPSYNLEQNSGQARHRCGGQPHGDEVWTPSLYDGESSRSLFWSRPGEERQVPFAWPMPEMWGRFTAALVEKTWEENPPTVEEKTPHESFTIAFDEVLFYRPCEGRTARVLIAPREDVVHLEWHPAESTEEQELAGPAVSALLPQSVLPLSFTDSQRARSQEVLHVTLF